MDKNIKNQRLLTSCSSCGKGFGRDDVSLILREHTKTLFHATCPNCKTAAFIKISASLQGTAGLGIITDLDRKEIGEKFFSEKVGADEVLDAYEILDKVG